MDTFIISLIDAAFLVVGKGFLWLLRAVKMPSPELGHWGAVVLGFVVTAAAIFLGLLIFFMLR